MTYSSEIVVSNFPYSAISMSQHIGQDSNSNLQG
jgi:hypothetical protein